MARIIPMFALSPTMEEGVIVKWIKTEGDNVSQSEVICEVETDKATMEFESPEEGTLLKIIAQEGQSVPVGADIAVVGEPGEDISELIEKQQPSATVTDPASQQTAAGNMAPSQGSKVRSTPAARMLAAENDIDISTITGTGPQGRITQSDIEQMMAPAEVQRIPVEVRGPIDRVIPVTAKRKVIAQTLSESKFTAPHYYLKLTVACDNLINARTRLNRHVDGKVTINAFLMKYVAETLKRHPMINSTWQGDTIAQHAKADIALAVAQPDGLIAPVVRDCASKGIGQIDEELKALIEKTKKGSLTKADYADSTFTISSLGAYGIEEFTAIINPPGSAILDVGKITKTPVVAEDDRIGIQQSMKLTLSCDHRLIDGTTGAKFLNDLKEMIEYPVRSLY